VRPSWNWLNPFDIPSLSALTAGMLVAVFIYWGWDSLVSVNEETEDATRTPVVAAIFATIILVAIYVIVSIAAPGFPRAGVPDEQLGRRSERARQGRARLRVGQAADHRRTHLGVGVDPDDNPADLADDTLDGLEASDPSVLGPHPSAPSDAEHVDHLDGSALDCLVRRLDKSSARTSSSTRLRRSV
jgi:hypothetical protein